MSQDDYDDNAHEQPEDNQSNTTPTLTLISPTNASDSHPSLTKKDNAMKQYSRITPEKGKYVTTNLYLRQNVTIAIVSIMWIKFFCICLWNNMMQFHQSV